MKEKLKKSLKLEKRTIRKLAVRSGLRGGASSQGGTNQGVTRVTCLFPVCHPGSGLGQC